MQPNFIIIGAPKCGTTSLCHQLGKHPQVFMSKVKEPHFFGRSEPKKTLDWYEEHFIGAEGKKAVGEGSTSYTHPHIIYQAALDIKRLIPKCRLIYIVRHPIKRLESDWKMRRREGWAEASINEAVKRQETLISHGMYWQNISIYHKLFSESQILVLFLEDFSQDPMGELKKCFKHIDVDPSIIISNANKPKNVSTQHRIDGIFVKYLRKTLVFKYLKKVAPDRILNVVKPLLTYKQKYKIDWAPKVKSDVIKQLKGDSQIFLDYYGKPHNFWNLYQ